MAYSTKKPDYDDDDDDDDNDNNNNYNNNLITCWPNSTIIIEILSSYLTNITL